MGLPTDRTTFLALAALLGERLGFGEAPTLRRIVRSRGDDPAAARLAARALAAGLDPSAPETLAIVDSIGARDPVGGRPGGRDGREPGGGPRAGEEGHGTAGSEADIVRSAAACLENAAEAAGRDKTLASLSRPGTYGGWSLIPFELSIDETSFAGAARIWYDRPGAPPGRMVVDIRSGGRRNLLDIRQGPSGPRLLFRGDDEGELAAFREAFSGLGAVETGNLEDGDFEELAGLRPVDGDA